MAKLIKNKERKLRYLDNMDGIFSDVYNCNICMKELDENSIKKRCDKCGNKFDNAEEILNNMYFNCLYEQDRE